MPWKLGINLGAPKFHFEFQHLSPLIGEQGKMGWAVE